MAGIPLDSPGMSLLPILPRALKNAFALPAAPLPPTRAEQTALTPAQALERLRAGSVPGDDTLGGMEFACAAGAKLIVVVGHTGCGAVAGAAAGGGERAGSLAGLLARIRPAVATVQARQPAGGPAPVDAAAEEKVRRVAATVSERSPELRGLVEAGQPRVVAAMRELGTGQVRLLEN